MAGLKVPLTGGNHQKTRLEKSGPADLLSYPAARYAAISLIVAYIAYWFFKQYGIRIPGDALWLTGAANHILAGKAMSEAFFDNNPPMSYLAYLPAALLTRTGIGLPAAVYIYATGLIALFAFLLASTLLRWPDLGPAKAWALWGAWFLTVTVMFHGNFAMKDHFIAIALPAFLLLQYALTLRLKMPRWLVLATFVIGAMYILIKPHYGLLPVLLMAHRSLVRRDLSFLKSADTLVLAAATVFYAALVYLRFPDFISEILELSVLTYLTQLSLQVIKPAVAIFAALLFMLGFAIAVDRDTAARNLAVLLVLLAMASLIPVLAQFKGFAAHFLPTFALGMMGGAATICAFLPRLPQANQAQILLLPLVLVFALGQLLTPERPELSAQYFKQAALARYLEDTGATGFFMEGWTTSYVAEVSAYTGIPHLSRFPSLWFAPALNLDSGILHDEKLAEELRQHFGKLVAGDLDRHRPALVFVLQKSPPGFGMLELFGGVPAFKDAWQYYRKEDEIALDYSIYPSGLFPGSGESQIMYDVYSRVSEPNG